MQPESAQPGFEPARAARLPPSTPIVSSLAYIPFRVVYVPTALAGRVAAWLAQGYRTASALERLLILPSWALSRGLFLVGSRLAHMLYRRLIEQ